MNGTLPGPASSFVVEWLPKLRPQLSAGARALDLAMGSGRHTAALVAAGFETFGVDRSWDRLHAARRASNDRDLRVHQWAADLDTYPLPTAHFDLLLCTRFLLRARWADLRGSVRPGGFVVYETFTDGQVARRQGPTSADHLLQPGELREAFSDWHVLAYEEVERPAALARLVACRPGQAD